MTQFDESFELPTKDDVKDATGQTQQNLSILKQALDEMLLSWTGM